MLRYLSEAIQKDLKKKAILLSGPRQVGKATFARSLAEGGEYLNYDILEDRKAIMTQSWRKDAAVVILDEIHKFPKWKNFLKGIIDQFQNSAPLIVTGSARLEVFRKAGDALTGRTFAYHLHPIDIKEACYLEPKISAEVHMHRLLSSGGFPESFYDPANAARLLRDRLTTVLREDLRDLSAVSNLKGIELLVELLRERVGGQITYSNLAKDLLVSAPTIKTWVDLLEKLYLVFLLRPYSKGLAKSIRKEPKCYFFDCSAPTNGEDARLENLAALSLLKWCDFERDSKGRNLDLMYYRDINGREVDFVITEDRKVLACIEVKSSDSDPSKSLLYLSERVNPKHSIQLVKSLKHSRDHGIIKVRPFAEWLNKIEL
jgi:predicted AAA+ superfamily ATPase